MSKLNQLADLLNKIQDSLNRKEWFSSIDTDLNLYINNLNLIVKFLLQNKTINTKNEHDKMQILNLCKTKNRSIESEAALRQRLNFYVLLGVVDCTDDCVYSLVQENWDFLYNDEIAKTFIYNSISIFKKFNKLSKTDKRKYIPSIKIFIGFIIFSIIQATNNTQFDELKNILNENTKYKLNKLDINNVYEKSHTLNTTYTKFYKNYFYNINIDDILNICLKMFNDENIDYYENLNIQNYVQYEPDIREKLLNEIEKIKMVMLEKKSKDDTKNKIKNILRKDFNINLRKDSNFKSDVLINEQDSIDNNFLESSHIISVSEILDRCINLVHKDDEKVFEILKVCKSNENGLLMPMNYHKFYDGGYICISNDEPRFILTEKGHVSIETLKLMGYTEDHKIKYDKYKKVIENIKNYKKIVNN